MFVEQRSHARPRSPAPPGPGPVPVHKRPAPSITPPHGVAAQGARVDAMLEAGAVFPCDRLYAVENGPSGFDPGAPGPVTRAS